MATAAAPADAAAPKKKKGKKLIMIVALLVLVGAGVGGGLFFTGMLGGSKADHGEPKKDLPKLVAKGSKPAESEGESEGGHEGGGESESEGGGQGEHASGDGPKYESSYFQMEKEFTSNLQESTHLIQVGLAISTPYDQKVIDHLKTHEMAVRSAVLMTLSETDEEQVFTADGKKDLQKRLVKAINGILKEKEGFGGVGNVYFTNFIVQ